MHKEKKGFTLSEALVTLAVIGVIAAVSIPTLSKMLPDKDAVMYKKAISTLSQGLNEVAVRDSNGFVFNDYHGTDANLCYKLTQVLNTMDDSGCYELSTSYDNPNFITTDGIRFWGFNKINVYTIGKSSFDTIYIDRTFNESEINDVRNTRVYNTDKDFSDSSKYIGLRTRITLEGTVVPRTLYGQYLLVKSNNKSRNDAVLSGTSNDSKKAAIYKILGLSSY